MKTKPLSAIIISISVLTVLHVGCSAKKAVKDTYVPPNAIASMKEFDVEMAAPAEAPPDITGDWKIFTTSHKGFENWELKIIADGAQYNPLAIHQYLGYCEGIITLKGDEIKMVFAGKTPGPNSISQTFTFTGTVEGETMRGTKVTAGENLHGDDKPTAWVALKKNENVK